VTKLNTNAEGSESLRVLAKRKADDQHSDVQKKYLKGNIGFIFRKYVTN